MHRVGGTSLFFVPLGCDVSDVCFFGVWCVVFRVSTTVSY